MPAGTNSGGPAAPAAGAAGATRAATTTHAVFTRPRQVDRQRAVGILRAVEHADGFLGFGFAAHLHEREPLRTAGVAIRDESDRLDRPRLGEEGLQIGVACRVREVSD